MKLASSKSLQTAVVLETGTVVTFPVAGPAVIFRTVDITTGPTVTFAAMGTNTVKFVAVAAEVAGGGGLVAGGLVVGGLVEGGLVAGGSVVICCVVTACVVVVDMVAGFVIGGLVAVSGSDVVG